MSEGRAAKVRARLQAFARGASNEAQQGTADAARGSVAAAAQPSPAARPELLQRIPPDRTVEVDVREELRAGREPFSRIMAALRDVPAGGALCVRAIFEPVPLYAVMQRNGLQHWTELRADDDWLVWFYPVTAAEPVADDTGSVAGADGAAVHTHAEGDVVILDVRGLEPPEPMERTLRALEQLRPGATLVQLNVRVPKFLLPLLEERGFSYEIREQDETLVRLFIRRTSDAAT